MNAKQHTKYQINVCKVHAVHCKVSFQYYPSVCTNLPDMRIPEIHFLRFLKHLRFHGGRLTVMKKTRCKYILKDTFYPQHQDLILLNSLSRYFAQATEQNHNKTLEH
jgi:hypothetical protein